ncbi:MAG: 3-hydroxyisobutyrate dehydrogenase, partial [Microbacterium sp.]|uniref:NAD(P)-binding domain-containing protein n=1 Tax=Microbacterium sp. TaxID=51671 RepID=UPI000DB65D60
MNQQHVPPKRIAWLGFGEMGRPMADRLASAGHDIRAIDLRKQASRDDDLAWVRAADIVCTCLPGPAEIRDVWMGTPELVDALSACTVVIDFSTIGPDAASEAAELVTALGHTYIDSPVSG